MEGAPTAKDGGTGRRTVKDTGLGVDTNNCTVVQKMCPSKLPGDDRRHHGVVLFNRKTGKYHVCVSTGAVASEMMARPSDGWEVTKALQQDEECVVLKYGDTKVAVDKAEMMRLSPFDIDVASKRLCTLVDDDPNRLTLMPNTIVLHVKNQDTSTIHNNPNTAASRIPKQVQQSVWPIRYKRAWGDKIKPSGNAQSPMIKAFNQAALQNVRIVSSLSIKQEPDTINATPIIIDPTNNVPTVFEPGKTLYLGDYEVEKLVEVPGQTDEDGQPVMRLETMVEKIVILPRNLDTRIAKSELEDHNLTNPDYRVHPDNAMNVVAIVFCLRFTNKSSANGKKDSVCRIRIHSNNTTRIGRNIFPHELLEKVFANVNPFMRFDEIILAGPLEANGQPKLVPSPRHPFMPVPFDIFLSPKACETFPIIKTMARHAAATLGFSTKGIDPSKIVYHVVQKAIADDELHCAVDPSGALLNMHPLAAVKPTTTVATTTVKTQSAASAPSPVKPSAPQPEVQDVNLDEPTDAAGGAMEDDGADASGAAEDMVPDPDEEGGAAEEEEQDEGEEGAAEEGEEQQDEDEEGAAVAEEEEQQVEGEEGAAVAMEEEQQVEGEEEGGAAAEEEEQVEGEEGAAAEEEEQVEGEEVAAAEEEQQVEGEEEGGEGAAAAKEEDGAAAEEEEQQDEGEETAAEEGEQEDEDDEEQAGDDGDDDEEEEDGSGGEEEDDEEEEDEDGDSDGEAQEEDIGEKDDDGDDDDGDDVAEKAAQMVAHLKAFLAVARIMCRTYAGKPVRAVKEMRQVMENSGFDDEAKAYLLTCFDGVKSNPEVVLTNVESGIEHFSGLADYVPSDDDESDDDSDAGEEEEDEAAEHTDDEGNTVKDPNERAKLRAARMAEISKDERDAQEEARRIIGDVGSRGKRERKSRVTDRDEVVRLWDELKVLYETHYPKFLEAARKEPPAVQERKALRSLYASFMDTLGSKSSTVEPPHTILGKVLENDSFANYMRQLQITASLMLIMKQNRDEIFAPENADKFNIATLDVLDVMGGAIPKSGRFSKASAADLQRNPVNARLTAVASAMQSLAINLPHAFNVMLDALTKTLRVTVNMKKHNTMLPEDGMLDRLLFLNSTELRKLQNDLPLGRGSGNGEGGGAGGEDAAVDINKIREQLIQSGMDPSEVDDHIAQRGDSLYAETVQTQASQPSRKRGRPPSGKKSATPGDATIAQVSTQIITLDAVEQQPAVPDKPKKAAPAGVKKQPMPAASGPQDKKPMPNATRVVPKPVAAPVAGAKPAHPTVAPASNLKVVPKSTPKTNAPTKQAAATSVSVPKAKTVPPTETTGVKPKTAPATSVSSIKPKTAPSLAAGATKPKTAPAAGVGGGKPASKTVASNGAAGVKRPPPTAGSGPPAKKVKPTVVAAPSQA